MRAVRAKSSETRAILLLIASDAEHLWIRVNNIVAISGRH